MKKQKSTKRDCSRAQQPSAFVALTIQLVPDMIVFVTLLSQELNWYMLWGCLWEQDPLLVGEPS